MTKKKRKVPFKGARIAGAPKLPLAIERFVETRMRAMAKGFASYVRRNILPNVADFARAPTERHDATGKDVPRNPAAKGQGKKMKAAAEQAFSAKSVNAVTDKSARMMARYSEDEFKRLKINVKKEPELKWLVKGWQRDIAERVKGLAKHEVDTLEEILATGQARHAETMAREIEERLGIIASKSAFIARDAVTKLNGRITRARYLGAGITHYVWTTQGDDRVRDSHIELEGEEFETDGDGAPDEGHPGEPPLCRCIAWPAPPEEDIGSDDEEEDES